MSGHLKATCTLECVRAEWEKVEIFGAQVLMSGWPEISSASDLTLVSLSVTKDWMWASEVGCLVIYSLTD